MEEAVAATVVDLDRHRLDGARAAALRNDTASQAKLANCCWAIGLLCRGTYVHLFVRCAGAGSYYWSGVRKKHCWLVGGWRLLLEWYEKKILLASWRSSAANGVVVAPVAGWPGILLIFESVCEKTFPVDGLHVPSSILLLVVHA